MSEVQVANRLAPAILAGAIAAIVAGCNTSTAPSASAAAQSAAAATSAASPAAIASSAPVATVVISKMAASLGELPDVCSGPAATDFPSRYTFTVTLTDAAGSDITALAAPAIQGKMAHLTLAGPPDAGTYDAPIGVGAGGTGLKITFPGGYCAGQGFSTFQSLTIDGVPLQLQADGTARGTIALP